MHIGNKFASSLVEKLLMGSYCWYFSVDFDAWSMQLRRQLFLVMLSLDLHDPVNLNDQCIYHQEHLEQWISSFYHK